MKTICTYAADAHGRTFSTVEPVTLIIQGKIPELDDMPTSIGDSDRPFYTYANKLAAAEAEKIMAALTQLPGGVLQQLLVRMLEHHACYLRVPMGDK